MTTLESKENPHMLPAAELRHLFQSAGIAPGRKVVSYCHSVVQGAYAYFTAKYLGYDAVLYDGSFQEWSNAPAIKSQERVGRHTSISNTVSPVKHFLRHTTASAPKSAPFRSHRKLGAIINQRLACNLSGGTQSDPTISPVATSIMITTSNSLRRERDAQSSGR